MKKTVAVILSLSIIGILVFTTMLPARATTAPDQQTHFKLDLEQLFKAISIEDASVLSDKKYSTDPDSYSQLQVAKTRFRGRRVVAMCRVPVSAQSNLRSDFEDEIDRQLLACGALQKGEEGADFTEQTKLAGEILSTDVNAPRKYFAIGKSHGLLDAGLYAHQGQVFITISYMQ